MPVLLSSVLLCPLQRPSCSSARTSLIACSAKRRAVFTFSDQHSPVSKARRYRPDVMAAAGKGLDTVKWVSATIDDDSSVPGMFAPVSEGHQDHQGVRNQIQLSTYAHHIGNGLSDLHDFMEKNLQGAIGGLHLLPFYPSSGDGGFAPITYKEVDPEKGTWADIDKLAKKYDLMVEFMVNHISPASQEFQDFLSNGPDSEYWPMFIHWNQFWEGEPTLDDLERIRTRKAEAPVLTVDLKNGKQEKVWCTFSPQQIDIDVTSKQGIAFIRDQMKALCSRGARLVRLDAFGYATKKRGTPCFFEEPEVWKVLDLAEELANATDTRMLCEVHESYETNIALAKKGYWVYDFALPLLILHAFTFHTAKNLRRWMQICPKCQITVLDTHDGMGIDDISGLAEVADVDELAHTIECTLGCDPNFKYIFNKHTQKYESRPHQFNCTYFSAVGRAFPQHRERMYLMARAIQFFTPGIPMIYYVGLLAGENDLQAMRDSLGSSRGINRHRYSVAEAEEELQRPVVQALLELCRFRNSHPAFNGEVHVNDDVEDHLLEVSWRNGEHSATLYADLRNLCFHSDVTQADESGKLHLRRYEVGETASPPTSGSDADMKSSQRPVSKKTAFADV